MGFVMVHGPCFSCNRVFAYNPHYVPSLTVRGERVPFCRHCIDVANPLRESRGLPPIVPHPQAYEPLPESEL